MIKKGNTWQDMEQAGSGDCKGRKLYHNPTNIPSRSNYVDLTCKLHRQRQPYTNNLPGIRYLTTIRDKRKSIVLSCSKAEPFHSADSAQENTTRASKKMAGEGSLNESTNKDLHHAKEMYKKWTSQRNKHKIIELEAMVQEEEKKLSEQQLGKEVDWLLDPGTTNTRATQFVRTQAEIWRMKTLLVKALSIQDEHAEQLQKL